MEFSSTVLICLLGVGIKGFTVYRGVLISGGWNRRYSTVYRGVFRIEFYCIQKCPHFMGSVE